MCSRACGADVSFRDVTIKIPDRGCDQGREWRQAAVAWAEIWEKSVSRVLASEEDGWLSELTKALRRVRTWFGVDAKVSIERLYLPPYAEKTFNSKVIKSFVPELRSRKCFLYFGIPMLSICALWTLWTFCVPVWICLFHIFIYGYVTHGTYKICLSSFVIYIYIYIYINFCQTHCVPMLSNGPGGWG